MKTNGTLPQGLAFSHRAAALNQYIQCVLNTLEARRGGRRANVETERGENGINLNTSTGLYRYCDEPINQSIAELGFRVATINNLIDNNNRQHVHFCSISMRQTYRMKATSTRHYTDITATHITELAAAARGSQRSLTAGWSRQARGHSETTRDDVSAPGVIIIKYRLLRKKVYRVSILRKFRDLSKNEMNG